MSAIVAGQHAAETHRGSADLESTLAAGLAALDIVSTARQRRVLLDFIALMSKWNRVYNLTAVRDPRDMLVVHVLDSLSVVGLLDGLVAGPVVDIGSGAGLPAIPLATMRPQWQIRSIDAVAKKVGFQRQACAALELSNLTPTHSRVEDTTSIPEPSVIVSRAYADLARMLASVERLATVATTVVAMKGAVPSDEIDRLPPGWSVKSIAQLTVPFLGAERCAIVLCRAG